MTGAPVTIAMACDRLYLYPFAVALTSFRRHSPVQLGLRFGLAQDWQTRLSNEELRHIVNLSESLGVPAEPSEARLAVDDLPPTLHISPTAFVKPAMFDQCADGQVLVWMDADMIALRDWTAVVELAAGAAASAVHEAQPSFEAQWSAEGTDWYANTGVVVVNGSSWQAEFAGRWRPYLADYAANGFRYLDQDVLNAMIRDRWNPLPQEFNYRLGYSGEWADPAVVHFAGWWKPWLSVGRQARRLDGPWRVALSAYAEAEDYFVEHVRRNLSRHDAGFWTAQRRRVRGAGGWRAWRHYARGVLRDDG